MTRLVDMLLTYYREHPSTPDRMNSLLKMKANFDRSGTFQEAHRSHPRITIERVDTLPSLEENNTPWQADSEEVKLGATPSPPLPPTGVFSAENISSSRPTSQSTSTEFSPQSGLVEINRLLEIDPTLIPAYLERANLYEDLKQYAQAIADYTHILEQEPQNITARLEKAKLYEDLKQYDQAIADYEFILSQEPQHETALFGRGKIHLDTGNHKDAIKDYNALIEINNTLAEAFHNRGLAYQRIGKFKTARQDLTQAIALKPNYTSAYQNRGIVFSELGDYDAAIDEYLFTGF